MDTKNCHKVHCALEFQHNFDQILKTLDTTSRTAWSKHASPESVNVQSDSFAGLTNHVSTRSDKLSEEKIVQDIMKPAEQRTRLHRRRRFNDQLNNSGRATTLTFNVSRADAVSSVVMRSTIS